MMLRMLLSTEIPSDTSVSLSSRSIVEGRSIGPVYCPGLYSAVPNLPPA